jgi:glycosyltransferase involved in cell wall biosynthesis
MGRARRADIIYAQDPVSVGLPARIASMVRGKRLLLKIVGDYAWEQGTARFGVHDTLDAFAHGTGSYPLPVRLLKRVQRFVAEGAAGIVVPSKYLQGIVEAWGIDRERITVIYNGVQLPRPTASGDRGAEQSVVSIGRLVEWKGFTALVDAFTRVQNKHPNARLSIIGDGPVRAQLEEHIAQHAAADAITLTGSLEREQALSYLASAQVFALNTHYEGLSHTIIEAMGCGVPVVTTNIGGNPELVDDGQQGFLVAPDDTHALADRLSQLLSDGARRAAMGERARKRAQQFSRTRMVEETAAYLRARCNAVSSEIT